jgi:predicted flap endonuclease-1-like 5' DNA nuclease
VNVDVERIIFMSEKNSVSFTLESSSDLPNIGKVARRELANAGYTRLEQFTTISEKELLKIHGVGPKAIRILREALEAKGLSFTAISSGNR